MNWLRMRYGLWWRNNHRPCLRDFPRLPEYAIPLLIVAVLWAWAMNADYKAEATRAQQAARVAELTLNDCMNGMATWRAEDGTEVGCMPAQTNDNRKEVNR